MVEFGYAPDQLLQVKSATPVLFNNTCGVSRQMHDVEIEVKPGSVVYYRASSGARVWSGVYTLYTLDADVKDFTLSLLGDMGINSPIR